MMRYRPARSVPGKNRLSRNEVQASARADAARKAIADAHVVNLSSHEPSLEEVFLTYYRADGTEPSAAAVAVGSGD